VMVGVRVHVEEVGGLVAAAMASMASGRLPSKSSHGFEQHRQSVSVSSVSGPVALVYATR